jgi:hypothetical protein
VEERGFSPASDPTTDRISGAEFAMEPGNSLPDDGSGELKEERKRLYEQQIEVARDNQNKMSDEFDKNLLALSSGALGVSLAFIKDIVPLKDAGFRCALYLSWVSFTLCILVTLMSFRFSMHANAVYMEYLYKYYIEDRSEYFNKQSPWSIANSVCAILGSIFFLAGLTATLIFAIANLTRM